MAEWWYNNKTGEVEESMKSPGPDRDGPYASREDAERAPEILTVREQIRSWRFYDQFRTDATAPARFPQVGTHTPVLGHDGADFAAALQTLIEIGEREALVASIEDAFPGASVSVEARGSPSATGG